MRRIAAACLAVAMASGLAACSSNDSTTTPSESASPTESMSSQAPGQTATVTIAGMAFSPSTATVAGGGTVTWTNDDSVAHTVTFDDASITSSGDLAPGGTFTATFPATGTYTYHCKIHPSMTGVVTVE